MEFVSVVFNNFSYFFLLRFGFHLRCIPCLTVRHFVALFLKGTVYEKLLILLLRLDFDKGPLYKKGPQDCIIMHDLLRLILYFSILILCTTVSPGVGKLFICLFISVNNIKFNDPDVQKSSSPVCRACFSFSRLSSWTMSSICFCRFSMAASFVVSDSNNTRDTRKFESGVCSCSVMTDKCLNNFLFQRDLRTSL